ncbi:hypothetical protein HOG48_00985 [Candidatus Peregrinibacteria bacterium]|jgi:hypothetical protein|nr:hypothetical protein [Candidatus Peregrinibacteria bacterium]
MKTNIFKKFLSAITSCALLTSLFIPALAFAEDDVELLYLDQFEEFEIDDYSGMLTTLAEVTYSLSFDAEGNACSNTTKFKNKEINSTEELAKEFESMLAVVSDDCWNNTIGENAAEYDANFKNYGYGRILEWYRDVNWEINNSPKEVVVEKVEETPEPEKIEEVEIKVPTTIITDKGTKVLIEENKPVIIEEPVKEEEIIKEEVVEEILEEVKEPEKVEEIVELEPEKEIVEVIEKEESVEEEVIEEEKEPIEEEILEEEKPIEEEIQEDEKLVEEEMLKEEAIVEEIEEEITKEDDEPTEEVKEVEEFVLEDEELEKIVEEQEKELEKIEEEQELPEFWKEMNKLTEEESAPEVDADNDGLTNAEELAAGTDPKENDSDNDGLADAVDPDPLNSDSDGDLIPDGEDSAPETADANEDGISDAAEKNFKLEVAIPGISRAADTDNNGVADIIDKKIEENTGHKIETSFEDTSGDGASDALKAKMGLSPTKNNNASKEFTDAETIIGYKNISKKTAATKTIKTNVKTRVINYNAGDVTTDQTPFFQGNAPEGSTVAFFYKDYRTGKIKLLGKVTAGAKNKFVMESRELPYGTYEIFTRTFDPKGAEIDLTKKIPITIAAEIPGIDKKDLEKPSIIALNAQPDEPTVAKGYTVPGNIVIAEWQSLILSSAVIADQDGYYEIATPKEGLEAGEDHTLWLYSMDPETKIKSENAKVEFSVAESTSVTILNIDNSLSKTIILILLGMLIAGVGIIITVRRKKKA